MSIEELNAIAGASTTGDAVGCASAIAMASAMVVTGGAAALTATIMSTVGGSLIVLGAVGGMVSGCINTYDDVAPPEWQTAQLIEDFFNVIDTVAYYMVHVGEIVEDLPTARDHVEIKFEGEAIFEYYYDFTDPQTHT